VLRRLITVSATGRGLQRIAVNQHHLTSGAPTVSNVFLRTRLFCHSRPLIVLFIAMAAVAAMAFVVIIPVTNLVAAQDVGHIVGAERALYLQSAREAVRSQLLTLGAGIFAAGALVFTGRNYRLSSRTLEVTEQGQVTDRYTRAIEQLGSEKLDVRLGGIYALERVAGDSARDHPVVTDVLAAFIREHSREEWRNASGRPETRPDIQAALTVIGRRNAARDSGRLNLANVDLVCADLRNCDFKGTSFADAFLLLANLDNSCLAETLFYRASLRACSLKGADLSDSILLGADLRGADLTRANLSRANLMDADLRGANLSGACLADAGLLTGTIDQADLTGADIAGAVYPLAKPLPDGWVRDPETGRIRHAIEAQSR
jgi:Pentapeptide repeats (8 copies)